tara:strand:+ start:6556 stop:8154 length:1599 start_codon:yes stop_codon:yes gene_type:complete
MPRDFQLQTLQDFSGGLNLRSDQFNLADNESPSMLNVDVDPRGGIKMRRGVKHRNTTALIQNVTGLCSFTPDSNPTRVIASHGTTVVQSQTTDFAQIAGVSVGNNDRLYGMTMNNKFYGVSGTASSFSYDGTTGTNLSQNMDGSAGNFPICQYSTFHANFAWAGLTYEGGSYLRNRVRWSNANEPEKWTSTDYVDVNVGERGDEISALVPFGDRLLIFKTNSVHALYGFGTESFQLVSLTQDAGSVSKSSPTSTPYGVYFWHDRQGVWLYDGSQFIWIFEKLQPAIDDGRLQFLTPPQLAWFNNRLYVSVDWSDSAGTPSRRTLIYDPSLGQGGAWTMTDIDVSVLLTFMPPNALHTLMGATEATANTGRVVLLEQDRESDLYDPAAATHIASSYSSTWLTGKNPIVRKRWGKPRMITSSDSTVALTANLYTDYDRANWTKQMPFGVVTTETSATWASGQTGTPPNVVPVGGTGIWNTSLWAAEAAQNVTQIQRLPTLGTAKAISIEIEGPTSNDAWEINAMAFTYLPRRLR